MDIVLEWSSQYEDESLSNSARQLSEILCCLWNNIFSYLRFAHKQMQIIVLHAQKHDISL